MSAFQELINGQTPVLVDFHATWCQPCKVMSPILKEVSKEIGDKGKVIKIDVDKNQKAAASFNVRGVPTFILFKEGKVLWRQSGVVPKEQLVQLFDEHG